MTFNSSRLAMPANHIMPQDEQYLLQLGARVRDTRARLSMSRKTLAADSGVSERYLAQLEGGHGNISILLLRQVAQALSLALPDLLREEREHSVELTLLTRYLERLSPKKLLQARSILVSAFGELDPDQRRRRIALIGLRGAGKSTLGRKLAEQFKIPFVELDQEIEREAGVPLAEVFSLYGQAAYRRMERRCLENVIELHARAVIATGGSLVTEPDTYETLRAACFTVWLKASSEEHMERVIAQGDLRPMTGRGEAMADLRHILDERDTLYRLADATVETSGRSIKESLKHLETVYNIS